MNLAAASIQSTRLTYEHLLSRVERVRQLIPSPVVMANDAGRRRLITELEEVKAQILDAPTFGSPGESKEQKRDAKQVAARVDEVIERIEAGGNPAKLHRDAAAVLELARKLARSRMDAAPHEE